MGTACQTHLSDAEWALIEPHLPASRAPGRLRVHSLREILDVPSSTSCMRAAPGLLSHDFPTAGRPSTTIFRLWRIDGTWERLHEALRKRRRLRLGREPQPSAGIVDPLRASRPPASVASNAAIDPGKKVKGRKRHLLVDTQGLWCSQGEGPRGQRLRPRRDKAAEGARRAEVPSAFRTCGSMLATTR